jgi:transposase
MRSEDKLVDGFTRGTSKVKTSVMVWLCVSADGSSVLLRCKHRQDSESYIADILTPALDFIRGSKAKAKGRKAPILFQQDNASCHVSKLTKAWLASKGVALLEPWPAMSPDLNLVEHCWSAICRNMIGKTFDTEDALWQGIQSAWQACPSSLLKSLYSSMNRRLAAVSVARGGNTHY